jgi:hypothetical protein
MGASQIEKSFQLLDEIEQSVENLPNINERRHLRGYIAAARAFLFNAKGDTANIISNAKLADELLPMDDFGVRAMNLNIWASAYTFDFKNYSVAIPILEQALILALQAKKITRGINHSHAFGVYTPTFRKAQGMSSHLY